MLKIASFCIVLALAWSDGAIGATAQQTAQSSGAIACISEAQLSHDWAWRMEPSLRPTIETQRRRLSDLCVSLSSATGAEAQGLLSDCLREAGEGPRHIQRGRDMDREHVSRQRAACRAAAGDN